MTKRKKTVPRGTEKKLKAIRSAARHDYPVSNIDVMLAEIESGYLLGSSPDPGPVQAGAPKSRPSS
ncbi:MAG: hypothetical protein WB566_03820 [Terriglobales bacterium]